MFVGVLVATVAAVAALFSPVFFGQFIAGRASRRTLTAIAATLSVVCAIGARLLYLDMSNHFANGFWSMAVFFVPLYMGMGLWMGHGNKQRREEWARSLASWQNQLTADRQASASPVRLSADYREIASLLNKLGRGAEAADEYCQAIALLEPTLVNHPSLAQYYREYLGMLSGKQHAEEIARVQAKLEALPKL
jgi:hypothetical protein